ncbi:MAG: N-acetylmuramoyl-L-alanine amidase [Opitutae bacterium]|nr:N-acetylmuramoyl-L-alanine amidase [Opitutae bacterium]
MVAGQFFHTGTRVVTWMDPGGYDAYRPGPRFPSPPPEKGKKPAPFPTKWFDARPGGADLPALQRTVDQFVLHYDQVGLSKTCFAVLHDQRGLSVHFMLDLDGTVYQTLDLKERAWHATTANSRSVGIEIANIGAFAPGDTTELAAWYRRDARGRTYLRVPKSEGDPLFRTPGFVGRPARDTPVAGVVQHLPLEQYDYTPEQYAALIKLTAALCRVFPNLVCAYPRDAAGKLIRHKLPDAGLANYRGLLGHFHVQTNKIDPGPAFQWDKVIEGARELLGGKTPPFAQP